MFKKILVPLDGSLVAERILPRVCELARLSNAEIELLTVVLAHSFPGVDPTEMEVKVVHAAEEYLEKVAKYLDDQKVTVSTHVRYGHDVEEILSHAEREDIDLVAMASHGRTGLGRWIMGSVSRRVVGHSTKPVLILRVTPEEVDE